MKKNKTAMIGFIRMVTLMVSLLDCLLLSVECKGKGGNKGG